MFSGDGIIWALKAKAVEKLPVTTVASASSSGLGQSNKIAAKSTYSLSLSGIRFLSPLITAAARRTAVFCVHNFVPSRVFCRDVRTSTCAHLDCN